MLTLLFQSCYQFIYLSRFSYFVSSLKYNKCSSFDRWHHNSHAKYLVNSFFAHFVVNCFTTRALRFIGGCDCNTVSNNIVCHKHPVMLYHNPEIALIYLSLNWIIGDRRRVQINLMEMYPPGHCERQCVITINSNSSIHSFFVSIQFSLQCH